MMPSNVEITPLSAAEAEEAAADGPAGWSRQSTRPYSPQSVTDATVGLGDPAVINAATSSPSIMAATPAAAAADDVDAMLLDGDAAAAGGDGDGSGSDDSHLSVADEHLYPHSFLPNLLRNWLWSRPVQRRARRTAAAEAANLRRTYMGRAHSHEHQKGSSSSPAGDAARRELPRARTSIAEAGAAAAAAATAGSHYGCLLAPPVHRMFGAAAAASAAPCSASSSLSFPSAEGATSLCASSGSVLLHQRPPPLRLGHRSLRTIQQEGGHLSNPASFPLEGAILFIDMSGFTPLSERLGEAGMLGVEALSRHLNDYFGPIVALIESHGGDIIKFAGDAIMVLFCWDTFEETTDDSSDTAAPSPSRGSSSSVSSFSTRRAQRQQRRADSAMDSSAFSSYGGGSGGGGGGGSRVPPRTLGMLVHRAVVCASSVHASFNNFCPADNIVLKLHSAISAGPMWACVVGGVFERYEFLLQGALIYDLAPALAHAAVGEIMLTNAAYQTVAHQVQAQEVRVSPPTAPPSPTATTSAATATNASAASSVATAATAMATAASASVALASSSSSSPPRRHSRFHQLSSRCSFLEKNALTPAIHE